MQQPPGNVDADHPSYMYKLHKSLYVLKQATRAWFERVFFHIFHLGFTASMANSCLFIFYSTNTIIYLLLYVDDIIITGNNSKRISHLIATLSAIFDLKDLGSLHYFQGIQITRIQFGLTFTQSKYASNVLHKFHMENSKPTQTSCCIATRLLPRDGVFLSNPTDYRNMVEALQYLTFIRPNLAFSVHQLCQFMSKPTSTHLEAAKWVFRYICGTLHHGISFTPGLLSFDSHCNFKCRIGQ